MRAYDETAAPTGAEGLGAAPPVAERGRFAALWTARVGGLPRTFWIVLSGQLLNRLGGFVQPFLALYLAEVRDLSLPQVGVVLAVYGFGGIASQGIGGTLTDRIGRRSTLLIGMLASAATLMLLGAARGFPLLLAAALLAGMSVDLYRPAAAAVIADVVPSKDRPRAYGLWFWVINLGFSGAAVLAGFAAGIGYTWLFVIDAASCLAFAVVILRAVPETRPATTVESRGGGGIGIVLRDRLMMALCGTNLLLALVFMQAFFTLPLVMRSDGHSPATYGAVLALNGVAIVLLQPLVLPWLTRLDRSVVLAAAQGLTGAGFALFAFADSPVSYAAVVVIFTLGEIGNASVASALVADFAPDHARGRYQGVYGATFGIAAMVAPLAGTLTLEHIGEGALWMGCLGAGLLMAAVQTAIAPAVRARTRSTDLAAAAA